MATIKWRESDLCEKPPVDSVDTLWVQNFVKITNGLPDKCVLHFTQKFKMATQKWQESDFCKMSPVHSADTLWVQNFVEITNGLQDKCVLHFTQKFKMATQKWQESDFCKMSPVHSADTLWVQNFVEIALSHTVSEINALLRFTQKFKIPAKSGGKAIFAKSRQ